MPGAPPKTSTSRPESSATAAQPPKAAAWRAFRRAFSRKLPPVSCGEGSVSSARLASSNGNPARSERNSRSLPSLPVAITNRLGGAGLKLSGMQLRDPVGREVQQLVELMTPKRVAFRRPLHFDECAAAVHHDIHVGFRIRILGIVQI